MVLWGVAGCGKTTIARELSKILKCDDFITVNGPELLNKYVGGSEEKVRKLFEPAEKNPRGFYVIFLDEMDSLCKKRGSSSGTGGDVGDKIVNQFLSKIDGKNSLNNILINGATNRLDMIDSAILRPGRLELHIEIGLPDKKGRLDILNIHTKVMRENGHLNEDFNIEKIAEETKNYTGAEIEGIIRVASSYPLAKNLDPITFKPLTNDKPIITMNDFNMAINELPPAHGSRSNELNIITSTPLLFYSTEYENIYNQIKSNLIDIYLDDTKKCKTNNILLAGPYFSGKTKMIAHIIKEIENNIGYIKYINAELLMKQESIYDYFVTSKTSDKSLLIFDSLEKIIEYSFLTGMCNSNRLNEIETIMDAIIKPDNKITLIFISNNFKLIDSLDFANRVNNYYELENTELFK